MCVLYTSGSDSRRGVSSRNVERSVNSDRLARLGVVVKRLAERDSEQEDEQHDERPHAPTEQLAASLLAAALVALDRRQRHGA